jgi:hypothetical protein
MFPMLFYKRILFFYLCTQVFTSFSQNDDRQLNKLDRKDSLSSIKTKEALNKNIITSEIHNLLFRNIYASSNYNEEVEFKKKVDELMPFEDMIIDTIIYRKFNVFGENIYDTFQKSSNLETFLSTKLHTNTKNKIITNRYLLFKNGESFSAYKALENARIIRTSGVFHDVRFVPVAKSNEHIELYIYLQDVFPYGFDLTLNSTSNFGLKINNNNFLGLGHQIETEVLYNQKDTNQIWGLGISYTVPNFIKKSFVDMNLFARNYRDENSIGLGFVRQFIRKDMRWAGGLTFAYRDLDKNLFNQATNQINLQKAESNIWLSHAIPFKSRKPTTLNSIILGARFTRNTFFNRPNVILTDYPTLWNNNFILSSIGYSRIRFVQERLLNGFGRTEDIPIGISISALYGYENTEYSTRRYYGGSILGQFYNSRETYFNLSAKFGTYIADNLYNQSVLDINSQLATKTFHWGKTRLRNFFNARYTAGFNQDATRYLTFSENNGIRGINNKAIQGNDRLTLSVQTNLYLPFSLIGFRTYLFTLFELANMKSQNQSIFESKQYSGATLGIAFRNENMIFNMVQIQYGFYPSTSNLNQRGIVISSVIPFRFQSLDISKPETVQYQ